VAPTSLLADLEGEAKAISGSPRIRQLPTKLTAILWRLRSFVLISKARLKPSPALLEFGPCSNKLWTCHSCGASVIASVPAIKAPYQLQAQASPPDFCQDQRFAGIYSCHRLRGWRFFS
jgi:hypothetical protein